MNSFRTPTPAKSLEKATLRDLAQKLFELYPRLPPILGPSTGGGSDGICDRKAVLRYLAVDCAPSKENIGSAVQHYQSFLDASSGDLDLVPSPSIRRLQDACTPEYERIVRLLLEQNAAAGMRFLLELRRDVLRWLPWLQQQHQRNSLGDGHQELVACLKQLDGHLREVFSTWFAPGMLEIRRITYDGMNGRMAKIALWLFDLSETDLLILLLSYA